MRNLVSHPLLLAGSFGLALIGFASWWWRSRLRRINADPASPPKVEI